jgi:hypothetical protein
MPSNKETLRRALQKRATRDKAEQIAKRIDGKKAAHLLARMEEAGKV